MKRIKVKDKVIVIAGKDKGKTGLVKQILKNDTRVLVEGVNMVKKTMKATQENPGGIHEKESSVHISNVMLYSDKKSAPSKVKIVQKDGKNIRVLKACGTTL